MIKNKTIGAKVRFTRSAKKKTGRQTRWVMKEEDGEGILVGFRSVQNGHMEFESDCAYFVSEEHIRMALVCNNLYRNPIYVPVECAFDAEPISEIKSGNHISLAHYNGETQ